MAAIDGKQIANILYHAGVETLLITGYSELGRKLLRRPAPKVDFNMGDVVILILLAMATRDMLIKQGIIPADIMKYFLFSFLSFFWSYKMASAVAMMIGGAVVNALAFTGGIFLFSKLGKPQDAEKERERHDRAVEQLEAAQAAWSQKRMQRLDFINEQMQKEHHAVQTFDDVDQAIKQYYYITGKQLDPLPPEPKLSDYYTPSSVQQNRELLFIVAGMAATGCLAYELI